MRTVFQLLESTKVNIHGDPSTIVFCPHCNKVHRLGDLLKMVDMGLEELVVCECYLNKPKTIIPKQYHTDYQKYLEAVAKKHYDKDYSDDEIAQELVNQLNSDAVTKNYVNCVVPSMNFVGPVKPKHPLKGDVWFDEVTKSQNLWDGNCWLVFNGSSSFGKAMFDLTTPHKGYPYFKMDLLDSDGNIDV